MFLLSIKICYSQLTMQPNGPAIWGGCVTRRKHRAESRYFSREIVSVAERWQMGTGAVSRYKLSRSQKFIKVQDFNCVQMRVSG